MGMRWCCCMVGLETLGPLKGISLLPSTLLKAESYEIYFEKACRRGNPKTIKRGEEIL